MQRISDTELLGFYARKRKTGIYFYLDYTISSKRNTLPIGHYPTKTAEQARNIVKQYLGRIAAGEDIRKTIDEEKQFNKSKKNLTVETYIENIYTTTQNRKKTGQATIQSIKHHFQDWMKKPLNEINSDDVSIWQKKKEEEGLSFRGIECPYEKFTTMLNHAVLNKHIKSHQLKNVKLEKPHITQSVIDSSNKRLILTKGQISDLFKALDAYQEIKRSQRRNSRKHGNQHLPNLDIVEYVDYVKPWILFMYYTGFRNGDIYGLHWEHIDFDNKTVRKIIEKTAHKCPSPKSFSMSEPLIKVLRKWQTQMGNPTSGLVFISPKTNRRYSSKAMRKPWKKIKKLANLPDNLDLYTLRHNFASYLIADGGDLLSVSDAMGHEDIETTTKYYGHLQPNKNKELVDRFATMPLITE